MILYRRHRLATALQTLFYAIPTDMKTLGVNHYSEGDCKLVPAKFEVMKRRNHRLQETVKLCYWVKPKYHDSASPRKTAASHRLDSDPTRVSESADAMRRLFSNRSAHHDSKHSVVSRLKMKSMCKEKSRLSDVCSELNLVFVYRSKTTEGKW